MKPAITLLVIIFAAAAYALYYRLAVPSYEYREAPLPSSFGEFYRNKLAASRALAVRPGNEEKLVRYSTGKTPVAFLYIHGYGASRAEGEYLLDMAAKRLKANTYYLRLPGHGTNKEDQLKATMGAHLDESITALRMMEKLGEKVIVAGSSMGGLIATYLASYYPDRIAAVMLVSPYYDFNDASARLLYHYPLFRVITALKPIRVSPAPVPPEADNWTKYWYREQYLASTAQLVDLRGLIARDDVYEKISVPSLLLYYDGDEAASVPRMKEAFDQFGGAAGGNPLNRAVAITPGDHVLLSKYAKTDEKRVVKEIVEFARTVLAVKNK
ncbi:MAG: alpha/beta fold hydrolase [Chrysiogenales bacterium]|nr:MAG: alpha/beta fold hydrolase [Chrysiogenales bacterium]